MAIKLTDHSSVKAVLAEMTLEAKAALVTGVTSYGAAAIPRLGIPAALLIDNGCGVNLRQYLRELLSNGKLNYLQMAVLREAMEQGTDMKTVRKAARPKLSPEEMAEVLKREYRGR